MPTPGQKLVQLGIQPYGGTNWNAPQVVPTVASLRAQSVSGLGLGASVQLQGSAGRDDGGQGFFFYDPTGSGVDDGENIIQPNVGAGRWFRIMDLSNRSRSSVASLGSTSVSRVPDGYTVLVNGFSSKNDGGQGWFVYHAASTATAVSGMVIAPPGGVGRWIRLHSGSVSVRMTGAKGDGVTNDTIPVQTAVDFAGAGEVYAPAGTYLVDSVHLKFNGSSLVGDTKGGTCFKFSGASSMGIYSNPGVGVNITGFTLRDFRFDMSLMPNVDASRGIFLKNTWDCLIENVRYSDDTTFPNAAWSIYFGPNCYTSKVDTCFFPRIACIAANNPGVDYYITTMTFVNVSMYHFKGRFVNSSSFYQCINQKHPEESGGDAFDLDACFKINFFGGDVEQKRGGYYLRIGTEYGCSNITSIGNTFAGLEGKYMNLRPLASDLRDEFTARAGLSCTVSRTGTVATVTCTDHYFNPGDVFAVTGFAESNFNNPGGAVVLTVPDKDHFTYAVANTGATSGTGGTVVYDPTVNGRYFITDGGLSIVDGTFNCIEQKGVRSGLAAAAGLKGEYLESLVTEGAAVPLANGVSANITSLSLTPGDWQIEGVAYFANGGGIAVYAALGLSFDSATLPPNEGARTTGANGQWNTTQTLRVSIPRHISSGSVTVYLVANVGSAGSLSAWGKISARRVR